MKDKKIIAYRSEQVKQIAYNLRKLIHEAVIGEWGRLGRKRVKKRFQTERIAIEEERSSLFRALKASICTCPGCSQASRDMVYNAPLKHWFCTQCAQEYRDFYHKNKAILDQGGFVGDFDEYFHGTFL